MANKKYKDSENPFKWKHAAGDVIVWLVSWYCRYALSYRDLQEMAMERGLKLERSTPFIAGFKNRHRKLISAPSLILKRQVIPGDVMRVCRSKRHERWK